MADKPQSMDLKPNTSEMPAATAPSTPQRVSGGHRNADMRDAMAEMAERAQLISQEAGTKIAAAMKDVISAAAGIAGFAVESARDLVQYMVRRGQMTQDEADRLIREAEEAQGRRPAAERSRPTATKVASDRAAAAKAERLEAAAREASDVRSTRAAQATASHAPQRSSVAKRPAAASASSKSAAKPAARKAASRAAKKPAAKKPAKKRR
jgi:polyhydroxyalkanoate synthesis regulator phasin